MNDNSEFTQWTEGNWLLPNGNTGYIELNDDMIKANHHHYVFVITLQSMKVYFNKTLIGSHVFNFGNRTPVRFAHFDYHIFGGTNQGVQGLVDSALTKQYWQGSYADIKSYNAELSSTDINHINVVSNDYVGDQKIYADKMKLSSEFYVNADKQLTLNVGLADYAKKSDYGTLTFTKEGSTDTNTINLFGSNSVQIPRGIQGLKGDQGGKGDKGDKGNGWTDASYNATTGILTFNSADGLGFVTGNLKGTNGTNGTNGKGWTDASYNSTTGILTFNSNDAGYAFTTGNSKERMERMERMVRMGKVGLVGVITQQQVKYH